MNESTKKKIDDILKKNDVCLFMKGTPEVPLCGFSLAVSNVLKHLDVKFVGINVLDDNEIRPKSSSSRENFLVAVFFFYDNHSCS